MTALVSVLSFIVALAVIGFALSVVKKTDTVGPSSGRTNVFGKDEIGKRVESVLMAMWSPDPNVERVSQLMDVLKEDRDAGIAEVRRLYEAVPAEDYDFRWALVNLATMFEHVGALSFLDAVVKTPIPPERSGERHRFPTVTRELMIRVRALEGVRLIATAGHDAARQLLLDHVKSSHFSIRKSAALGLLGLRDGSKYKSQITELLPKPEHFVLNIRELRVEDVGVIRYGVGAASSTASPAPRLSGMGDTPKDRSLRRKGPPTI